ncbi:MAG: glycosyltransferase [Bacteroidales bacterium]|nr:glycosyltransferase [Bacteroidales bacterium]
MKILFFIESLRSGGKERRLVELIKGLKDYPGIECELVLTRKEIHYKDIFSTGIKIHYIVRKYIKKDPRLFFKLFKIAKKYKPDIIHVWGNMVAIYAIPAKTLLKTPMINNQITDAPDRVNGGLLSHQVSFPFSNILVANSKAGLKSYNAPLNKSRVIHNGFDFKRIENLEDKKITRAKFEIKTNNVVGMVASFSNLKDYKTYIIVAKQVLRKNDDVTFLCIGSGDDSSFRKLVKPEYEEKVKFLGRQENVESIMNICNIGVLSTFTEGISNSIMEFMALGKPVIATDGGGTKELVEHDKTGFLIEYKNVNSLYEKILFLIENRKIAEEMGEKGKAVIRNKFSIDRMVDSFIFEYKKVHCI